MDIRPNCMIHIKNLHENITKDALKESLYKHFSKFGEILNIVALQEPGIRGQAFIVFKEISSATNALHEMQGLSLHYKPIHIAFSETDSDVVVEKKDTHEEQPNRVIFISNLPKVGIDVLKQLLSEVFSTFGEILDIVAMKTPGMRGKAMVAFKEISSATIALREFQGLVLKGKPMNIAYAKTEMDNVAKMKGTFKERAKKVKQPKPVKSTSKKWYLSIYFYRINTVK